MPRQPWQRRVVACRAGAPRLGVWAAAAADELLYLGYCPGFIFRADGAVVQPRLAARQRPLLVSSPPRSAGRLQQQALYHGSIKHLSTAAASTLARMLQASYQGSSKRFITAAVSKLSRQQQGL